MAKTKKPLKKGWAYFENFDEFFEKIQNGISRVFIDGKFEVNIGNFNKEENVIYFDCVDFPDDLEYLRDICEPFDIGIYTIYYDANIDDFELVFGEIISQKRLVYAKRQ